MHSSNSSMPAESRFVIGSSRIQSAARVSRMRPMATRRFCPADNARAGRSAHCSMRSRANVARSSCCSHWTAQSDAVVKILERREVRLERIDMSEVRELLVVIVATVVQLASAPYDLAGLGRQQPGHATQKARLADAVRTDHLQQLAALQDERRAAQKMPLAAPQMHGANVELRLRCGRLGLCMHSSYETGSKTALSLPDACRRPAVAAKSRRHDTTVLAHTWPTPPPGGLQSPRTRCPGGEIGRRKGLEKLSTRRGNARREWGQIRGTSTTRA